MRLPNSRFCALCLRRLAAIYFASTCSLANAEVKEVTLKELIAASDLIVVATVTKVEPAPASIKAVDDSYPAVEVATARVVETWKGTPGKEVRFVSSPTRYCDTSGAKKGERLVLFLESRNDGPIMMIAWVGRGGMPLREIDNTTYVSVQNGVILPDGVPTLAEEKESTITLPSS